ncbi:VOC family protein [Actinomadura sp. WMMB 499]|uniref:VOC family protein n=1 Tax=Actinomadura sp. WMMB 499 TaxID=1219491 RepID=UPI0012440C01|nr:VOC family protein [Actinomadura sp. WMMB 499]QFG22521.1 VOC family protein [Actinomadura sp. WMMB 499]
MDIDCVIIDATDPDRLAAFWSELLDRPIAARFGPYVWLERRNGLGIGFQRTDRSRAGKNRLHLDLASEDPAAEQARVEALGGRRLTEYDPGGFLVMADPEGNEFCIIPNGLFELDDEGRAHYLPGEEKAT